MGGRGAKVRLEVFIYQKKHRIPIEVHVYTEMFKGNLCLETFLKLKLISSRLIHGQPAKI